MQIVAGAYAKTIAGIGSALLVVCFSYPSLATEATTTTLVTGSASSTVASDIADSTNNVGTSTASIPGVSISTSKPVSTSVKTNSASQLASLVGGLALIVVLIYGLSWFVKRFSQGGFLQNSTMKIVSTMPLGTRERLMLVDVGGKQLLLGVTATQINTLHVFEEPVVAQGDKIQPATSDFSQKLMAILQQKNLAATDNPAHKKSNP